MSVNAIGHPGEHGGVVPSSVVHQLIKDDFGDTVTTARTAATATTTVTTAAVAAAVEGDVDPTAAAAQQSQAQALVQVNQTRQGIQQAGVREQILASQDIHASLEVLVAQVTRPGRELEAARTTQRGRKILPVPPAPADEATAEHGENAVLAGVLLAAADHSAAGAAGLDLVEAPPANVAIDVLL